MKSAVHVDSPPVKPLLVYDGDCRFCMLWIRRWQHATGDRVDYLPYQDPGIAAKFPEIPRAHFESAVQLIMPDGSVHSAADAVFRSLARSRHGRWLLDWYEHSPPFARFTEWGYRVVARHRTLFSFLTRMLWGGDLGPPAHYLVRQIFMRALGIIYLIAFASLGVQIVGLVGANGIMPAVNSMTIANQQLSAERVGWDRYRVFPTLCWFSASDGFLKFQCALGAALAVLVVIGIAPAPCLFLLWIIYLSLTTICDVFLGFQWDNLLLETGFLAIFFAPLQLMPRRPREAAPSRIVLWLLRWLLFRLMFESGCVKLLSNDATWRDLTALNYHYETQPLPTWIGWYAHQLPQWIHKSSTVVMFVIELAVPFLIFLPRRPRQLGCVAFLALQVVIFLTGNYCYFNLLTMALCVTLLDDAALRACSRRLRALFGFLPFVRATSRKREESAGPREGQMTPSPTPVLELPRGQRWPLVITIALAIVVVCVSWVHAFALTRTPQPGPRPVLALYQWLQPLRSFNHYGLFAVMTTTRPEIIIEGSNDGVKWEAYEFKYKAGDLKRRPGFVAPHQPRLDWQMWFAALSDYRHNSWIINVVRRLAEGKPEVTGLFARNPFPNAPPRFIRAVVYQYHFTDRETRRRTGEWWRREPLGLYLPAFSIRQNPNGR